MKTAVTPETQVMQLLVKEPQRLPAIARSWEKDVERILHHSPQEGTNPANTLTLNFWPPKL